MEYRDMPPIHDPVEELRRQRLADAVDAYGTVPAIDPRPFEQLWRERIADFLMGEGPFAAAGAPPGQIDPSAQLLTKPWAADAFYDRVGMPAASRADNAAAATGGANTEQRGMTWPLPSQPLADARTDWNRHMAQALRDDGTVPTSATDARPFDQLWRERVADPLSGDARSAMAGRPPQGSAQPMMSQQAVDAFYDRVGIPPARPDTPAAAAAATGAAETEQQRLARLMLSPQSLANAPGLREAQTALTAPTVTAGSFSPVPDYVRIVQLGVQNRQPKRLPGPLPEQRVTLSGPTALRRTHGGALTPLAPNPRVPLSLPPANVPTYSPPLSRRTYRPNELNPRTVESASLEELSAGVPAYVPEAYRAFIGKAAIQYGLPPALLARQIYRESLFNPYARGPRTKKTGERAEGIAQFMPRTANAEGIAPFDPSQAIPAQAAYLRRLIDQFGGDVALGLAAYNAGPGNVRNYLASGRDPGKLEPETHNYVRDILGVQL
jgi:hypothetical protein